ncbi:class IV lanthionine synthetase LanL [Streptomyces globisporus]|uniref:class IV lanthionine synthetase LanL n=1 Tax=Streptomyces globisporus TaxID=1908 RepID=UPI00380F88B3
MGENAKEAPESRVLADIFNAALQRDDAGSWTVNSGSPWTSVSPTGHRHRPQGWKLHMSSTPLAVPVLLARVLPLLLAHRCSFKFVSDLATAEELVAAHIARGSGGKIVTVYPNDDDHLAEIAEALHRVTLGLPGPVVLSDRRFRPDSQVYFRYGEFTGTRVYGNEGVYDTKLISPTGSHVSDRREGYFVSPEWVPHPEFAPVEPGKAKARRGPVVLGENYEVHRAIKHAYGGGVYRAVDTRTGQQAVIKQARKWAGANLAGTDSSHTLRNEHHVLGILAPLGVTPRALAVFEQQGDLFLAQEWVDGDNLRTWVNGRLRVVDDSSTLDLDTARHLVRQLISLVQRAHAAGLVLRDINPNNIIVAPDDRVWLIDMEHAATAGAVVSNAWTPGYTAPEVSTGPRHGQIAAHTTDFYGLGATLLYALTGCDPLLAPADEQSSLKEGKTARDAGVGALIDGLSSANPTLRAMAPMIRGLMDRVPADRWTLERAAAFTDSTATSSPSTEGVLRLPPEHQELLLEEGLAYVVETMDPDSPHRLWESGEFGSRADALAVQHGASGVLMVLVAAAEATGSASAARGAAVAATWVRKRLGDQPRTLPGLHFGRSGVAWALYEASAVLGEPAWEAAALDLARKIPLEWPNADICHGAAGAGMAMLHLWQRTGREEFLERAVTAAECAVAAARVEDGTALWRIPDDFDSDLAGLEHYGFAHGVAGISTLLLLAGRAAGRPDLVEWAELGAATLHRTASRADGAAFWPSGEQHGHATGRMAHWCSGSSGIGTFLVRLWKATGDTSHRSLAEEAAVAVRQTRWTSSPSACHGLAGDGDFLLDLAELLGDRRYHAWAEELASCMFARRTHRSGRLVLPDETNYAVVADYGTGLAGSLAFLLRLRHGGPRLWMPGCEVLA